MSRRTLLLAACTLVGLALCLGRSFAPAGPDATTLAAARAPAASLTPVPRYLIGFRAAWDNAMDLDLIVYQESTEEMIYWEQRMSLSGGRLDSSEGNDACRDPVAAPWETITWEAGAPPDRYVIQVQVSRDCGVTTDPQVTLSTIWSDGEELAYAGTLTADDPQWRAAITYDGTPPETPVEPYGPLDPGQEPVYGTTVLGAEDYDAEMVIGGPINLGESAATAFQGFVQPNPHLCFETTGGTGVLWLQTMYGAGDPALILVDPRARWWYNDDAGAETWIIAPNGFDIIDAPVSSDELDPLLRLSHPPQGRYCVWLASMTGEHHTTRLHISLRSE